MPKKIMPKKCSMGKSAALGLGLSIVLATAFFWSVGKYSQNAAPNNSFSETVVTGFDIVSSKDDDQACSGQMNVDLNAGAGGHYIRPCVTKEAFSGRALTDLTYVLGENATCPAGYNRIDKDLNKKAGGRYIWPCVKYGSEGQMVQDIHFNVSDNKASAQSCQEGYDLVDTDLNLDAGGDFIYTCLKKISGPSAPTPNNNANNNANNNNNNANNNNNNSVKNNNTNNTNNNNNNANNNNNNNNNGGGLTTGAKVGIGVGIVVVLGVVVVLAVQ